MDDTPKWLLPAALAAAVGFAIWWLTQPDETGATGLEKLRPSNPYASLGTALCAGGIAYYGGTASGIGAAPLCAGVGEAIAPVLESGVKLATTAIDAQGNIIKTAGETVSSGMKDTYSGVKTVVKDAYGATKTYAQWATGYTLATKAYEGAKKLWNEIF